MLKKINRQILLAGIVAVAVTPMVPMLTASNAAAEETVTIARKCANGVCGTAKYFGGRVRIKLSSKLSRTTHFNFKTNPGDQIELAQAGTYSFDMEPGEGGTYSAQACERGGIGARSTCTKWATFDWSSGGQEEEEDQ